MQKSVVISVDYAKSESGSYLAHISVEIPSEPSNELQVQFELVDLASWLILHNFKSKNAEEHTSFTLTLECEVMAEIITYINDLKSNVEAMVLDCMKKNKETAELKRQAIELEQKQRRESEALFANLSKERQVVKIDV